MSLIVCPAHNGACAEGVTLELGGFSSTEATIGACSELRAEGITSYNVRKSEALGFRSFVEAGPVAHASGLVWLGA